MNPFILKITSFPFCISVAFVFEATPRWPLSWLLSIIAGNPCDYARTVQMSVGVRGCDAKTTLKHHKIPPEGLSHPTSPHLHRKHQITVFTLTAEAAPTSKRASAWSDSSLRLGVHAAAGTWAKLDTIYLWWKTASSESWSTSGVFWIVWGIFHGPWRTDDRLQKDDGEKVSFLNKASETSSQSRDWASFVQK